MVSTERSSWQKQLQSRRNHSSRLRTPMIAPSLMPWLTSPALPRARNYQSDLKAKPHGYQLADRKSNYSTIIGRILVKNYSSSSSGPSTSYVLSQKRPRTILLLYIWTGSPPFVGSRRSLASRKMRLLSDSTSCFY